MNATQTRGLIPDAGRERAPGTARAAVVTRTAEGAAYRSPAILCNPLSGRCRKNQARIRALAGSLPQAPYVEATQPAAIAAAIERFAEARCDLLVVIGGDGTLGLVLTALHRHRGWNPTLSVVPGGTANTLALDLGIRDKARKVLARVQRYLTHADAAPAVELERRPLRVQQGSAPPRYGMVFGLGAIAAVVNNFNGGRAHKSALTGESAALAPFARSMAALVIGRFTGPLAPVSMQLEPDGLATRSGEHLVVLASTLERMLFGVRPYWGQEPHPLHYTAVAYPARHLRRNLPGLLRGRVSARLNPENGYHSANVRWLRCQLDGHYMLDGEIYPVRQSDGPLQVEAQAPLRFLQP